MHDSGSGLVVGRRPLPSSPHIPRPKKQKKTKKKGPTGNYIYLN